MRLISSLFLCSLFACGNGNTVDADPFPDFGACYDDHHTEEGLSAPHAITTCCLDHPIAGMAAGAFCGTTEASCEANIKPGLVGSDATPADITSACTDYINQR